MNEALTEPPTNGTVLEDGTANTLSAVVVFSDRAYVTRTAQAHAKTGLNRFYVELKAFRIERDSAQARVFGKGSILSVQYKEVPVQDAPQAMVHELSEQKRELDRRLKALQKARESLEKQRQFLDSVISFGDVEIPKELKTAFPQPQSLQAMLEFLESSYQQLAEREDSLDHEIDERRYELNVIERKLKQSKHPKQAVRKAIEVLFEAAEEQDLELEVSYVSYQASWQPVYKVDVPLALGGVDMTLFARIAQQTGEDWDDVALTVSNAVPLKGTVLPDAQTWRLYVAQPITTMMLGSAPVAAAAAELDGAVGSEEADFEDELIEADMVMGDVEASYQQAQQRELPLAFEYELGQPVALGSGGDETLLPLFVKSLDGEFYAYSVPRNDSRTYLVCETAGDSELLAGQLNVHFGGRFIGGTRLTEKKAGEALLVNLGADRAIKVERERVTDKTAETLFGMVDRGSVGREVEYRIVAENLKDEPARVQIVDCVPVSTTDRIQVKGVETSPEPSEMDWRGREGVMLWDLRIEAKRSREIRVKFFVKHPKGTEPEGL